MTVNPRWRSTVPVTYPPIGVFIGTAYIDLTIEEIVHGCANNLIDVISREITLCYGRRILLDKAPLTARHLSDIAREHFSADRVRAALRI